MSLAEDRGRAALRQPGSPPARSAGPTPEALSSMNSRGGRHPVVIPVFLEHGPQHLIEVLAAVADRSPQYALLNGAQLAQGAVGAAILKQAPRFEPMRAHVGEGERADQTRGFDENAGA